MEKEEEDDDVCRLFPPILIVRSCRMLLRNMVIVIRVSDLIQPPYVIRALSDYLRLKSRTFRGSDTIQSGVSLQAWVGEEGEKEDESVP